MAKTKEKLPSAEELKKQDDGYQLAKDDAVKYLDSRGAAVGSISRRYYLDSDELSQEAYEVLLTCLRDYNPIFTKDDGTSITVQFNTFFGSRLETRAMEMRNRDPEYQARQAVTDQMTAEEKEQFRNDPPLLVQHLDHETTLQEQLRGEVSEAYEDMNDDPAFKIMRDSFFDQKLAELVARESDEKKQAALLHVKVGGVYNFNEIAYHFGVTDSRASQVMNELMDAFYVQRLIDRDLKAVQNDFQKLKFNDKRILRLLSEAFQNVEDARAEAVIKIFQPDFKKDDLSDLYKKSKKTLANKKERKSSAAASGRKPALQPPAYDKIFTDKENKDYPLLEVGLRPISSLKELDLEFRSPETPEAFKEFVEKFDVGSPQFPAIVSEDGYIIDGLRRIKAAKSKGRTDYLCLTRKITSEEDKKRLRVVVNMRLHSASKTEMYYAISALSDMGYSQQKIADCLGTSRTNVLVYCKVRDKANPRLRGLFEDELIQVTNASACADLTDAQQERIVTFIRRYGVQWSKGKKFNKLYDAVLEGKEDKLVDAADRVMHPAEPAPAAAASGEVNDQKAQALQKQLETYAIALKDQEVWAAQREGVINQQREELADIKGEAEALRRELEAAELIKFGNPKAMEQEMKQMRDFIAVTERLAAATNGIQRSGKEISRFDIRRKQAVELTKMTEELEKALNTLRLELHNACRSLRSTPESDE